MHCNTAPFDNNDLRLALKYAMDREAMVETVLGGYGKVGNDFPINSTYALFPEGIEQRTYDPDKAAFTTRSPVTPVRSCCARRKSPSRALSMRCALSGQRPEGWHRDRGEARAGRRLLVERLERPALLHLLLGRPSDPGPDVFHGLPFDGRLERHALLRPDFDKILLQARAELDEGKRKEMYREMAMMVRDEGGLILPMFNDFVNAAQKSVKGYVHDIGNDMSNGYVATRVWLEA